MISEKVKTKTATKELFTFTVTAVIVGFVSIFAGFIFAPIAAAIYAGMILADKTKLKLPSVVYAIIILAANFLIKGKYDVDGVVFIPVAILLFLLYRFGKSKGTAAFWMTVCYSASVFVILLCYGFKGLTSVQLSGIVEFYQRYLFSLRRELIDALMSIGQNSIDGTVTYPITYDMANELFSSVLQLFPAIIVSLSFIFAGITIKLFDGANALYAKNNQREDWRLRVATPVAIFYILVVVAALFFTSGIGGTTLKWIELVLSLVFAYFGFGLIVNLIGMRRSKGFAYTVIILAFLLLGGAVISILSYIGTYMTIVVNGAEKREES